ncbi:SEC-C domain-containing protein [Candidatus Peregrinibacteria bacterium]|nr:SEC-C domain-containing protein [Candidatus Peregrinibacteria bacterium]
MSKDKKGKKVGRNSPCVCGTGLKYKRCCWNRHKENGIKIRELPKNSFTEIEAEQSAQRERESKILAKYGYYLPHIHTIFKGKRYRTVWGTIHWRRQSETFHEFLIYLLKCSLGEDWRKEQMALPEADRHIIMQCFQHYQQWLQDNADEEEFRLTGRFSGQPNGYVQYLISLAFDIYCLQHSLQLQGSVLKRLKKNNDEFQGARYEIAVAAIFARGGYKIEFYNESDPQIMKDKHGEFIVLDEQSGARIEVEAKSKRRSGILHHEGEQEDANLLKGNIRSLLNSAMKKKVNGRPYLIFIDLNSPPTEGKNPLDKPWFDEVMKAVDKETGGIRAGRESGIIITNFSWHYQGKSRAAKPEHIYSVPMNPAHPVPQEVWDKLSSVLNKYGAIPDLDRILANTPSTASNDPNVDS